MRQRRATTRVFALRMSDVSTDNLQERLLRAVFIDRFDEVSAIFDPSLIRRSTSAIQSQVPL